MSHILESRHRKETCNGVLHMFQVESRTHKILCTLVTLVLEIILILLSPKYRPQNRYIKCRIKNNSNTVK